MKETATAPAKLDLGKLTKDLREAQRLALNAANHSDDGGTCNFDALYIRLPRIKEPEVLKAISAAGLSGTKMTHPYYRTGYLINPRVPGQGNKRSRAAEAMCGHMRASGYDISEWCQAD